MANLNNEDTRGTRNMPTIVEHWSMHIGKRVSNRQSMTTMNTEWKLYEYEQVRDAAIWNSCIM